MRKKFQSLYYVNPMVSHLCIPETWSHKTIRLSRARGEKPIQCRIWRVPRTLINILENLLKSFKNPHKKLHHNVGWCPKCASVNEGVLCAFFCEKNYAFQCSIAFHIETSHLICTANQMIGFYMKCNTDLK